MVVSKREAVRKVGTPAGGRGGRPGRGDSDAHGEVLWSPVGGVRQKGGRHRVGVGPKKKRGRWSRPPQRQ